MKKLITGVAVLMASLMHAQLKEGTITYAMTLEGLPPEQAAMMGDMESKISFKDKKVFYEMTSMMVNVKSLSDENGNVTTMDQMGNKTYTKMTKEEIEKKTAENKDKVKDSKIEYTNETKTIAGYECKKAIVTYTSPKEGEQKTEVWYTEKIPYLQGGAKRASGDPFSTLKGMPMEYSMNQGPMKVKMLAKEISTDKIPDSKFVLSTEGYTESKGFPGQQQGK
ncbi:MAG: GLPGLI family protein [Bacteroidia bacterium]